ncbi:hypothetical protein CI610_00326 [invertebrate metagenome]|uniref:DUF3987 domain-containing protein n=1 Tax=invertebrate metagenome TaxID=1711999 RepID=A0A2H9TBP0_9ZZZZ
MHKEDTGYETVVVDGNLQEHDAGDIGEVIDLHVARLEMLDEDMKASFPGSTPDLSPSPGLPAVTEAMMPGRFGGAVRDLSAGSEAVPVAVAAHILLRFAALLGRLPYIPIGDERRWLNNYFMMVGSSASGKGFSGRPPQRLFRRIEEFLELDFSQQYDAGRTEGLSRYPCLPVHTGGLSTGEGLAAALTDGSTGISPVTDKRMLVFETEFGNVMAMAQRPGNSLGMVIRNAYDGSAIRFLTKASPVRASAPFLCIMGNITAEELTGHDQTGMMAANGMLNRFLLLYQHPSRVVPFPLPTPENIIDGHARWLADAVLSARNHSHETHWDKLPPLARPLSFSRDARQLWERNYGELVNRADCHEVMTLTRRHRLHALLISALFALMDRRTEIRPVDIRAGLAWCEYSRQSAVHVFRAGTRQYDADIADRLSLKLLHAIDHITRENSHCTKTDLYRFFNNRLRRSLLQPALDRLATFIPPLVTWTLEKTGGAPTTRYTLTDDARQILKSRQLS